jgi:hypothetical protein
MCVINAKDGEKLILKKNLVNLQDKSIKEINKYDTTIAIFIPVNS